MGDINTKGPLTKLGGKKYKSGVLIFALLFIIINWNSSCVPSFSYIDTEPWDLIQDFDCLSLVTFTANMFVWGLITPLILLSEIALGKPITERQSCDEVDDGYECYDDWSRYWGPYTPYYKVPVHNLSDTNPRKPASNCKVNMVQVLHRHGARHPTLGAGILLTATILKIQQQATAYSDRVKFLKNFKYIFKADELTPFGEHEMFNSGVKFYREYADLAESADPFVRVASQQRVVDSGSFFVKGFNKERSQKARKPPIAFDPVVIWEGEGFNNTLDHGSCYEFEEGPSSETGHVAQSEFAQVFTPKLIDKLKEDLPGVDLTYKDIINLLTMCPFDTLASRGGEELSPFCKMFDHDDFENYNHYASLGKYYGYGPGNDFGPAQGIGFVNELIARLTGNPVVDNTSTNTTLDSNPDTFPLDRQIYFDFSHDNTMISILSALQLFENQKPLSKITRPLTTDKADKNEPRDGNTFKASELVPFAARVYVEKLQCENVDEDLVKVIVNDRVMRLKGCEIEDDGACKLSDFIDHLQWARNGGNWADCGWPWIRDNRI